MMSLRKLFIKQCHRELILHVRQPRLLLQASLFFLMVAVFFPLTLPAEKNILHAVAPGLIWIGVLLSFLLTSVHLFQQDYEDGVIEQWLISGYSLSMIVFVKLLVQWGFNILALFIFCPLLALLYDLSFMEMMVLMASLFLGTPAILFLCGLAAAFSSGVEQKGVLMALILLPLAVPVMVFGSSTLTLMMQNSQVLGYLALLLAISILATAFLPFAIAAVVRVSLVD